MSTHQPPESGAPAQLPRLLRALVDDAAVFPPGSASLTDALSGHRAHRTGWYADFVGPLLLPASALPTVPRLLAPDQSVIIGLIGDTGLDALPGTLDTVDPRLRLCQVEVAVAKRGQDPQPGLHQLFGLLRDRPGLPGFAEVPLSWGLLAALDSIAQERAAGAPIAAKFRTGGLAAELFPTPVELAAVICACRERQLPFKLTAGLHHAVRHGDPETGFVHHGFLNILAATLLAVEGGEVADVAEPLGSTDPIALAEFVRERLGQQRPLWLGFGSCSVDEPVDDLVAMALMEPPAGPAQPAQPPRGHA